MMFPPYFTGQSKSHMATFEFHRARCTIPWRKGVLGSGETVIIGSTSMPPATYPFIEPLLMSQAPYGMGPNSEVMTTYTADQGKAALPQTLSFNTNVCV